MWGAIKDFCNSVRSLCSFKDFTAETKQNKRTAYVCFVPRVAVGKLFWIHACLNERFSHCFVFWDTPKGIIFADSRANVADISYMKKDHTAESLLKILRRGKLKTVKCEITPKGKSLHYFPLQLNPQNCVSLTKAVLGIAPRRVFTPFQLYRHLCSREDSVLI